MFTQTPLETIKARPTRVRWMMMGWVTAISILTYTDRLNLAIAGKFVQGEFSFSTQTMGWIFSAFLLGYALAQIPGGWTTDRFGPRRVLAVAIASWSLFTILTALAPQLPVASWFGVAGAFILIRFLVGIGEAPSSPSYTKIVASWMGARRRAVGSSFSLIGIGAGGAITPILIIWIITRWGWRASFYLCGAVGILIAAGWIVFARDGPEQHPRVNTAELAVIRSGSLKENGASMKTTRATVPWGTMLRSLSVWGLILGYMCQGYPIYFFHTWFYIYLVRVRGLSLMRGGLWDAAPYVAIALLAPLGGWFSDHAVRRMGRKRGRQLGVWLGMFPSAALIWLGAGAHNIALSVIALAAGAGLNMFAASTFWAACIDLGEKYSGSLSGLMNTFGNLGGWLSPIVTALIATHISWRCAVDVTAVVTLASGFLWVLVDASRSINPRL